MKRKILFSVTSLLLGATILGACTDVNYKVTFKNYWFTDANVPTASTETLTYDVSFEKSNGIAEGYSVEYTNGKYTASLSMLTENGKDIYRYETSLTIDVQYTYKKDVSESFTDTVKTRVDLERNAKLTPISSHKEILNHAPTLNPTSLKEGYTLVNYTVDTTYSGNGGKTVVTNNATNKKETNTFSFEDKYTWLDNEELLLALRGISQSATTSNFYVYAPFSSNVQTIKAAFGSKTTGVEFEFKKDGADTATKAVIDYYPVTLSIDSKNSGSSQTVWIAATDDVMNNTHRNVILRMQMPVSYSLGTLVYTLESATYSK